jgi:putative transposase
MFHPKNLFPKKTPDPFALKLNSRLPLTESFSRENRMPRRNRFSTSGYVFHVLNRSAGRRTLFETPEDYDAFLRVLEQARSEVGMRLLAFCVMPNHWHLVLWPETDDALSNYLHWLSVTHAQRWHKAHGTAGTGPVYQGRFKSFPIQEGDHFYAVCRYVERNALRAGLVTRAELWRWSSLWQWQRDSAAVSLNNWPLARPQGWAEYVNRPQTENELAAIRHSVLRGRPFGDNRWIRSTATALGLGHTLQSRGRPPA